MIDIDIQKPLIGANGAMELAVSPAMPATC